MVVSKVASTSSKSIILYLSKVCIINAKDKAKDKNDLSPCEAYVISGIVNPFLVYGILNSLSFIMKLFISKSSYTKLNKSFIVIIHWFKYICKNNKGKPVFGDNAFFNISTSSNSISSFSFSSIYDL